MKKILIVEDDASIALGLVTALCDEGYEAHAVHTGTEGLHYIKAQTPDLVILDVMLPGMSGLEICKYMRDEEIQIPIILLTARSEEIDKVLGLELGADDYVTKPFGVRELLARVKAHLRREAAGRRQTGEPEDDQCRFGDVVVDFKRHEVLKNHIVQELTNREFRLLAYFLHHPGELLTRERLLQDIWGYDAYPSTRTVDNHIVRLRKHIEPDPEHPRYIKTIRGAGYLFETDASEGH